jgi:TrmH family RNA methyltransferase
VQSRIRQFRYRIRDFSWKKAGRCATMAIEFNPPTGSGPPAAIEAMHENTRTLVAHSRDPRFLNLRTLQTPQGRSRTGLYLIEGVRHLARAVECQAPIESVFVDPSVLSNRFGQKLLHKLRQSGIPVIQLTPPIYRELTRALEPQGIGAVVRQRWIPLAQARPSRTSFWLAVEAIDSPGNLGTIIRTGEAAGVSGIFLLGSSTDPWDPAAVRASMGSLFSQKLVRCTVREFTHWAKAFGVLTIGSSPSGLLAYKALRCRWPAVLLIGSERQGLSEQLIEFSDFMVRIPMHGGCDSMNAAVAAGVLLFEMSSQRNVEPGKCRANEMSSPRLAT